MFLHLSKSSSSYQNIFVSIQMNEMELPRAIAERTLREHHGNVVDALVELTD